MSAREESETVDRVCAEAFNEKSAEPLTWESIRKRLIWRNVFQIAFFHTGLLVAVIIYTFGLYPVPIKWLTLLWLFISSYGTAGAVTAGAHRLWTHRSYKANLRLRILLMILHCGVGMNSIFHWVKDHRIHHKYSETDADPHNAKRGFFFSHMGWLMLRRHPEYLRRSKEIDMSDIIADPVVMFNKKYATELKLLLCFIIPTLIPIVFWGEAVLHAVMTQCFIRITATMHSIWSVNSVAHIWGTRPYNKLINPAENRIVSFFTMGEGSHNYHHTFPWDYKASEWPYFNFNSTTLFIHAMAKLGWAYDFREPSPELVEKVIRRIGYKSEVHEE